MEKQPYSPARQIRRRRWQWRERVALWLCVLLPALALWGGLHWLEIAALTWLCIFGAGAIVTLRGDWRLVGPHFRFDLVRLARRGRSATVRVLYLAALLAGLGLAWIQYQRHTDFVDALFSSTLTMSRFDLTRMAEAFCSAVIVVQNLAVLILTPVYMATAVTEERDMRSLEMLQTTHMHDREIILGKLLGRLGHLAGILLAGLPVLTMVYLVGGVDMVVLLANFANTAMNLWTAGCVCIMCSVIAKSGLEAMVESYLVVPAQILMCSVVTLLLGGSTPMILWQQDFAGNYLRLLHVLWALLLTHGVVSSFFLIVAFGGLRPFVHSKKACPAPVAHVASVSKTKKRTVQAADPVPNLPAIKGDALFWKEVHLPGRGGLTFWHFLPNFMGLAAVGFTVLCFVPILLMSEAHEWPFGDIPRAFFTLAAWFAWIELVYRTCGSVARERQRETLDNLLTLPVNWTDILKAKWLAGITRCIRWSLCCISILLLGVVSRSMLVTDGFFHVLSFVVFTTFLASLGIFCSVTSKTVLQAQTKVGLIIFILLMTGLVDYWIYRASGWMASFNEFLNPFTFSEEFSRDGRGPAQITNILNGSVISFREPLSSHQFLLRMIYFAMTLLLFVAASAILWRLACRSFCQEAAKRPS
jgi:ABC-type transport system involved in multi-copper enzyme maturation permease subunit